MNVFKVRGKFNWGDLIIAILLPITLGFVSTKLNFKMVEMYNEFEKPFFFPPAALFPVMWVVLYVLIGIASYRIWMLRSEGGNAVKALTFYSVQLIINFAWPFVFFHFQLYGLAFFLILILLVFLIYTAIIFIKLDKFSGILMIPYILWLIYAGVLNFFIWFIYEM